MGQKKGQPVVINDKQFESKSEVMKYLYDEQKLSVSEIVKAMKEADIEVRYQFVYSVIDKHTNGKIKQGDPNKKTKSQMFREMYDEGKTVGEIAKETGSNYTFVFSVIKKYRQEKGK